MSDTIRAEDGSSFHAETDWIMAILTLGAAAGILYAFWPLTFDFDSREFNPVVFVPVFLGAYGLNHLVRSILGTVRAKLFGVSVLEIRGSSVRMGETIHGVVRTVVELQPTSDYELHLQCIETFEVWSSSSNSNRQQDRIRWEHTIRVAPESVKSKAGIPFQFTLPPPFEKPDPSKSSPVIDRGLAVINIPGIQNVFAHNVTPRATRWILEVRAPLKGVDYYAIFGIVVQDSTADRGISVTI